MTHLKFMTIDEYEKKKGKEIQDPLEHKISLENGPICNIIGDSLTKLPS